MSHRQARKLHSRLRVQWGNGEGWLTAIGPVLAQGDLVGLGNNIIKQGQHLLRLGARIEGGHQFNRLAQIDEIGLQLGLKAVFQHGMGSE